MNIKRALTWLSAIGGTIDNVIIGTIAVTTGITVPDAVNGTDAVNLHTLQDHVGFDVDYYFHATSAMSTTVTESETYDAETLNATPVDTMTLFYKSTVLDTPAPFTLNAGSNINFHFNAKVSTVTGVKLVTVQMRLFYVDADGTSNKTAIAPISDPTASLTATKTYCELHSHVATEITVPTGKRLWIELYANTSGASGNYPDLWIYRDSGINHLSFSVAGGILGNFVQKTELATPPAIGKTTPAEGWFSPNVSKGPATLTTFAGTVSTSGSSTTITFTSAADAILAGYDATNPILGTTLITTAVNQASVTRYIMSWTNSTACVVDTACTLAASSTLASVQLPIAQFVDSSGVVKGWMNAAGNVYFVSNVGIGTTDFGTSAVKVLSLGAGTAPTTSPADVAQMWVADVGAVAGKAALHMRDEVGNNGPIAFAKTPEYVEAATDTLTLDQCYGGLINNYGQANDAVITLPTIAAGMNFTVILGTTVAKYYRIDPGTNDSIYLDGVTTGDGKYVGVASAALGNAIQFQAFQTGAGAYDWYASTISGAFVAEA